MEEDERKNRNSCHTIKKICWMENRRKKMAEKIIDDISGSKKTEWKK